MVAAGKTEGGEEEKSKEGDGGKRLSLVKEFMMGERQREEEAERQRAEKKAGKGKGGKDEDR